MVRIYQRSSRVEEIACHSVIEGSLINPRLEDLREPGELVEMLKQACRLKQRRVKSPSPANFSYDHICKRVFTIFRFITGVKAA